MELSTTTKRGRKPNASKLAKATSPMDTPDRFKLGEAGFIGTNMFAGVSNEEIKKELNFPYSIRTYKQMSYHSAINAAFTLYEVMIDKANWKVNAPVNATAKELEQTDFIRTCMLDMEHSWRDFIKDALSMEVYGFSVHEKVFRKRYTSNGSLYNDGLIGWKKLPIRSQESINKFLMSEDGNDVIGVQQNTSLIRDPYLLSSVATASTINLPKKKILHFRAGRHRGDPFGRSLLRDAYLAWRYLIALEEIEAIGVSKDLSGTPILYIPPEYMRADASPEQKALYEQFKSMIRNFQNTQQTGAMLPQAFDERGNPLFKLDLLKGGGTKNFDTTKVKEYYKNLILTSLFADVLVMGQSSSGSYALGSIKTTLIGNAIESMLKSIKDVINSDLVRHTYELNGWDASRACSIDYDDLERNDLEGLSKFIQRVASVGLVVKDVETINRIRQAMGVDNVEMTDEELQKVLTPETSRASDGMAKGSGNGTSDEVSGTDNSSLNLDNAS